MNSRAPPASPRQLMGSDWIERQLTSPIRAPILADECGIGKTLQIEWHWCCAELKKWFGGYYDIAVYCGSKIDPIDANVRDFIISDTTELQAWVDKQAASHGDPKTLQRILLPPYAAAIRRLGRCKNAEKHGTYELEMIEL
ncbi:hypothetical protein CEP54_002569 [Fusarium duplospermum]|uniref:SNF2 N-terminal domain-containing protein n=1 Tax=Fusarium duplospermum TaxID=1325734 RepID=A0A428QUG2_9HYPO|nr:hypothetical protein CEP54_002569 [Fusarium duplospermum]